MTLCRERPQHEGMPPAWRMLCLLRGRRSSNFELCHYIASLEVHWYRIGVSQLITDLR